MARAASGNSRTVRSVPGVVRVHEQGNNLGLGNQLGYQLEPLEVQLGGEVAEAGQVAAGSGETGDQAGRDRIADTGEDDRDRRGCAFRRQCRTPGGSHDHSNLAADGSVANAGSRS